MIIVLVVCAHRACAQAPHVVGAVQITSSTLLQSVMVDSDPRDDRIYAYGSYMGTLYVGSDSLVSRGERDGFIVCLDLRMQLLWMQTIGGPGFDGVDDITIVPNDGVIATMSCGAGTASITTYTIGDITFSGRGNTDVATAWFGRDGSLKWARNDGAENFETPSRIHRFQDGTIAVIGSFGSQSRFGTEQIVCGKSVTGGFVQLLSSGGEHVSVAHSVSVPSSGNPDDADGSLGFRQITGLTDTSFTIVVSGIGTSRFRGTSITPGELGESGLGTLTFHRSAEPSSSTTWRRCSGPWTFFEAEGYNDGVSGADMSCIFRDDFFIVWHEEPHRRKDTIAKTYFRERDNAGRASVHATHRSGSRSLVFGTFVDTLDLPQTPSFPDAVAGTDTLLPQAYVLIGDAPGEFRRVLHIPSTTSGDALWACSTAEGMAVVMSTAGTITLPDTSLPGVVNGVTVVGFRERGTGIWEQGTGNWEPGTWHLAPGTGNGEWGVVFTALGGMVAQGSITREFLGALVPGVYVIQSGGRLSLCHVLSADNIAFAVPAAASRKGP